MTKRESEWKGAAAAANLLAMGVSRLGPVGRVAGTVLEIANFGFTYTELSLQVQQHQISNAQRKAALYMTGAQALGTIAGFAAEHFFFEVKGAGYAFAKETPGQGFFDRGTNYVRTNIYQRFYASPPQEMTKLLKTESEFTTEFNTLNEEWSRLNSDKKNRIKLIYDEFGIQRDLALKDARTEQYFRNGLSINDYMQTDLTTIKLTRAMEIKHGRKVDELRNAAQSQLDKINEEEINIPKRQMEIRTQLTKLSTQKEIYESRYNEYLFRQRMVQYGIVLVNPTLGDSEMGYNIYAQYNFQKNSQ